MGECFGERSPHSAGRSEVTEDLKKMVEAMRAELERQVVPPEVESSDDHPLVFYDAGTGDDPEDSIDGRFNIVRLARAALEAVREPSEAMVDGHARTVLLNDRMGSGSRQPKAAVIADIHRAIIDQILKSPGEAE